MQVLFPFDHCVLWSSKVQRQGEHLLFEALDVAIAAFEVVIDVLVDLFVLGFIEDGVIEFLLLLVDDVPLVSLGEGQLDLLVLLQGLHSVSLEVFGFAHYLQVQILEGVLQVHECLFLDVALQEGLVDHFLLCEVLEGVGVHVNVQIEGFQLPAD